MTTCQLLFDEATKHNIDSWLNGPYDSQTKEEIRRELDNNPENILDAFYTKLSFGTGGLRGIMGIGSNRINIYTIGIATQGLANYINKQPSQGSPHSVLIGYDSRNNAKLFAQEAAQIFAANGIKAYIYNELRPVPLVSFGCRYKKCTAAVMITASHNPPEYNGYKVYWDDGGQVLPPHDKGIMEEVNAIENISQIKKTSFHHPLVEVVHQEIDQAYISALRKIKLHPLQNTTDGSQLKIVYTSLHGAGITIIPHVLRDWGFINLLFVDEQVVPDGLFPTVSSPNPEEHSALQLGIERLIESKADILLASDPDADRLGVVVLHNGKPAMLTGNETVCICLHHICQTLSTENRLPANAAFVKTLATTELFQAICDAYKRPCFNVLTGFKYIGQQICNWERNPQGYQYIFGGEESCGSLFGTHVRDKDAVSSSALIAEIALNAKKQGLTLVDLLHQIYKKYGLFREKLLSITLRGKEGADRMQAMMAGFRKSPPIAFANVPVKTLEDYKSATKIDISSGKTESLSLPQTDMLLFRLADESKLIIRPSGTEPKIKLYCGSKLSSFSSIEKGIEECDQKTNLLLEGLKQHLMEQVL